MNKTELFKADVENETDVERLEFMFEAANEYAAYYEKLAEKHAAKIAKDLYSKDAELFKLKALVIQERLNNLK